MLSVPSVLPPAPVTTVPVWQRRRVHEAPSQLLPSRLPAFRPPPRLPPQATGTLVSRPSPSSEQPSLPFIFLAPGDPSEFSCEAASSREPSGTYRNLPRNVACQFSHLPRRLCTLCGQVCLSVAAGGSRLSGHAQSGLSPHAGCQAEGQTPFCLEHPARPSPRVRGGLARAGQGGFYGSGTPRPPELSPEAPSAENGTALTPWGRGPAPSASFASLIHFGESAHARPDPTPCHQFLFSPCFPFENWGTSVLPEEG